MSERFESEDGVDNALSAFYRHLHIENMICDISIFLGESQLAHVWCQRCGFKMTREVSECVHNPANGLISVNDLSQHHVVPCIYVNWSQNRGPNNASEGMIQGLGGAAHELVAGLTDTVLEPVNALFKGDGITGAVTGVVHGLRGFMISPLSGGKILLSKVTEGLKNSLTNPSLPDPNNQFSRDGSYQRPDGSVYLETRTIQEETSVPLSSVSHSPVNVHPKGFSTLDHSIPLEMSCFFSPNLFENEVSPDVVELDHVLQQTLKESVLESDIPASSDSFSSNESQTDFPQINFEAAMLEESNQQNELQPPSDDEFCSDEDQAENSLMLESQVDMSAILGSMALEVFSRYYLLISR